MLFERADCQQAQYSMHDDRCRATALYEHTLEPVETINRADEPALAAGRAALNRQFARQFPPQALPKM